MISALLLALAWWKADVIIPDQTALNMVSYYGSIVTVLSFAVALIEIFRISIAAKNINEIISNERDRIFRDENISLFSNASACLANVAESIQGDRYEKAYHEFKSFKLSVANVRLFDYSLRPGETNNTKYKLESKLEEALLRSTSASFTTPLDHKTKLYIIGSVFNYRDRIVARNESRR